MMDNINSHTRLDEMVKKIVNDNDIFYLSPIIFDYKEWSEIKKLWNENKIKEILKRIDNKLNVFKNDKKIAEIIKSLKIVVKDFSSLFRDLLNILKRFGYLKKYNLPDMDKFGRVLELYNIATVNAFFMEKIRRERDKRKKKALAKVLSYIKEALEGGVSKAELAYIVRKLESFKIFYNPKEYYGG